jgi:hypothetical protein
MLENIFAIPISLMLTRAPSRDRRVRDAFDPVVYTNRRTDPLSNFSEIYTINESICIYLDPIRDLTAPIKIHKRILIKDAVDNLKLLKRGWSGPNSTEIDVQVINNSIQLIESIPDFIIELIDERESVTATPYGTIVIDFEKNNKLISVEIGKNKSGFFTENLDKDWVENYLDLSSVIEKIILLAKKI